jgi:hypothetical protein
MSDRADCAGLFSSCARTGGASGSILAARTSNTGAESLPSRATSILGRRSTVLDRGSRSATSNDVVETTRENRGPNSPDLGVVEKRQSGPPAPTGPGKHFGDVPAIVESETTADDRPVLDPNREIACKRADTVGLDSLANENDDRSRSDRRPIAQAINHISRYELVAAVAHHVFGISIATNH